MRHPEEIRRHSKVVQKKQQPKTGLLRSFFLFNDIGRPLFGFQIHAGEILTDDPEAEKLDPADQEDDADQRRIARDRVAPDQGFNDDHADHHKRDHAE